MGTAVERSLTDRRLVIITGKGGTGKSTVAAALALAATETGKRVALIEMGRDEHLHDLFAPGSMPAGGGSGREILPGLHLIHIEPFEALAEYLQLKIGVKALVDIGVRNRAFRQLLAGAPGWRELVILGKIWYLEQLVDGAGEARYDIVIVDAPASGHGLTLLDVPRITRSAIQSGPLRRNAVNVEELLRDPQRTLLLPVALAEELPAVETGELVTRVREAIQVPLDRVVVNGVMDAPFPPDYEDLPERLDALADPSPSDLLPPPSVLAECGRQQRARHRLNRDYVNQIARSTGVPALTLPQLASGIRGPEDLRRLSRHLMGKCEEQPGPETEAHP